jgi:hypothetical protein
MLSTALVGIYRSAMLGDRFFFSARRRREVFGLVSGAVLLSIVVYPIMSRLIRGGLVTLVGFEAGDTVGTPTGLSAASCKFINAWVGVWCDSMWFIELSFFSLWGLYCYLQRQI